MEDKRENYQKMKLLRLMELLWQTDENNTYKTRELCAKLREMKITCDTRTLGKDIRFLNEQGYEIITQKEGHENAYYIENRWFTFAELKILIDAVQAAAFITKKKTRQLIEKIAALGGNYKAEILKRGAVQFNKRKHKNEAIYYTVDNLETALLEEKKVSFHYFHLDENHQRVFARNGERYLVEPMALILYEDNYYLVCYHLYYKNTYTFRVDRMIDVDIVNEGISDIVKEQLRNDRHLKFVEQAFKMFGGDEKAVRIQFADQLIGTVYDKFGEEISMKRVSEKVIEALIKVQVSPMFFGWVSGFPGMMEITWPDSVKDRYRAHIKLLDQIITEPANDGSAGADANGFPGQDSIT